MKGGYCAWENRGKWYARVWWYESGERKEKRRIAENKTHARQLGRQLFQDIEKGDVSAIKAERMTFKELAEHYEKQYVKDAVYVQGRKVSGMRSPHTARTRLKALREHFDARRLSSITYDDLATFKAKRLATKTRTDTDRSIASVNRELNTLQRILNIAKRNGWIKENPMRRGEPLISSADENERMRILTREESELLLSACVEKRADVRPVVLMAIDTGMRQGEIIKLRWHSVNFARGIIFVEALNTKTLKPRTVPMTARLKSELLELWDASEKDLNARLFKYSKSVWHTFDAARRAVGLSDVRFHDLRHTAITWMLQAGLKESMVMKISGHTQYRTFLRYVNIGDEIAQSAAEALNAWHSKPILEESGAVN